MAEVDILLFLFVGDLNDADDGRYCADGEAATIADVSPLLKDRLPEDLSLAVDVSEEAAIGQFEDVENGKPEISNGWNDGTTSGWAIAEAPCEEITVGVTTPKGTRVLGSAPTPAVPAGEQPVHQLYTFYMIRIPRPVDDKGKADIMTAEAMLQAKADERNQHNYHVQAAKRRRNESFEKRQAAREVERDWLKKLKAKLEVIKPLRDGLKKIREVSMRDRSGGVLSSEAELDSRIASFEWRIQHESIPLKEEKQLIRDIKALETSRESVRQAAARNVQVQEAVGSREDLEEALRPLNAEYKQLELEFKAASAKRWAAEEEFENLNDALTSEMGHLHKANDVRQEAYEARRLLKNQEYGRLRDFYENKREIQYAKDLTSQPKSRKAVEEYCGAQVERILQLWNTNEEFRTTYLKENERSTVRRLTTLDGRALGPDEKPPKVFTSDLPTSSSSPERSQSKSSVTVMENGHQGGIEVEDKVKTPLTKEKSKAVPVVETSLMVEKSSEEVEQELEELKCMRRAAEMAKAKEAEERKKRTAERAQLKAQAWAHKEAEKKVKEREKRARKKSVVASSAEAPSVAEANPRVESNESAAEVEEAVVDTKKVSSKQRKRGVTSALTALKALEKIPLLPARRGRRKVLGLPVFSLIGLGAVAVVLLAAAIFMMYSRYSKQRAEGCESE